MRAPVDGGKDYLLYVEAETDLERSVLALFVERRSDERELKIIHAQSGHGGAGNVDKVFMAWGERKSYTAEHGREIELCAHDGCLSRRHKMSEFCEKHAREQPAYDIGHTTDG